MFLSDLAAQIAAKGPKYRVTEGIAEKVTLDTSASGEQSILYLTGSRRLVPAYRLVFLSCVVLGSVWEGEAVWELVDLCNALMAIPNLTALLLLSPQVLRELRDWERTGG